MNEYQKRNQFLTRLGFNSYADYLSSELWASIRSRVYQTKGRGCYCCPNPANQIHHHAYDLATLRGTVLRSLFPVCSKCHQKMEFFGKKGNGLKRHFKSVKYMLAKRRRIFKKNQAIDAARIRKGLPPVYFPK